MQLLYILPRPTQCLPRLRWASLLGPTLKMLFARSKSEKSEIPPPCAKSTQNVGYRQFLGTHNGPVNLNQSADRVGHPNLNHVRGHVRLLRGRPRLRGRLPRQRTRRLRIRARSRGSPRRPSRHWARGFSHSLNSASGAEARFPPGQTFSCMISFLFF